MCFASCSERRERQSVSDWACRGRGRGSQTVSPTQLHRTVSTGLEQLRAEQVSFLLLLLCAPAKASHGAACDSQHQQQNILCWNTESTWAPTAGKTTRRNQWQYDNRNMHFFHRQTTLSVCNCEWIKRDVKINTSLLQSFEENAFCVHIATQASL